jgi:aspartate/methionine/tyrosine aminotransferase
MLGKMTETMREALRMQAVQSPIIPVVGELIRRQPGTISLGQGVVFYEPPRQAFEQIRQFFSKPELHKYQPVYGVPELVEMLAQKLQTENGVAVGPNRRIVVTAGGNMAFMNAVLAICDPGDEVILPTPYYFNHEMAVTMANCRPVLVPTDENYQLQPVLLAAAVTAKTKAIVTVSPNNPTGAVYREDALRAVNRLCRERGIYHISDEAYEYFTYGGARHFSPGSLSGSEAHTISLFSLSKAYGFASWRIGWMVIPEHLFAAVNKVQDTILICPPVISQYAAIGALQVGKGYCAGHLRQLAEVREAVLSELAQLSEHCSVPPADGAFYFYLKLKTRLAPLPLVEKLIRDFQVAAIPGTAFGSDDGCYLRISYGALQQASVTEGVGRLAQGLKTILGE